MDAINQEFIMAVLVSVIVPLSLGFVVGYLTHKLKTQYERR